MTVEGTLGLLKGWCSCGLQASSCAGKGGCGSMGEASPGLDQEQKHEPADQPNGEPRGQRDTKRQRGKDQSLVSLVTSTPTSPGLPGLIFCFVHPRDLCVGSFGVRIRDEHSIL